MGWCSATYIFDNVASFLLDGEKPKDPKEVLEHLISELEDGDWDCQNESAYWEHPIVREIFKARHPSWFEDKE